MIVYISLGIGMLALMSFVFSEFKENKDLKDVDFVVAFIVGFFAGGLFWLILMGILLVNGEKWEQEAYEVEEFGLVSMKNNANVYLTSRGYASEISYTYITKTEKGNQIKELKKNERTYIKEENGSPNLKIAKLKYKNKFSDWLYGRDITQEEYTFTIPKGSMTNNFDIEIE